MGIEPVGLLDKFLIYKLESVMQYCRAKPQYSNKPNSDLILIASSVAILHYNPPPCFATGSWHNRSRPASWSSTDYSAMSRSNYLTRLFHLETAGFAFRHLYVAAQSWRSDQSAAISDLTRLLSRHEHPVAGLPNSYDPVPVPHPDNQSPHVQESRHNASA